MAYDPIMSAPTASEMQAAIAIIRRKAEADAQCARDAEAQNQWTTADAYWSRNLSLKVAAETLYDCIEGVLHDI